MRKLQFGIALIRLGGAILLGVVVLSISAATVLPRLIKVVSRDSKVATVAWARGSFGSGVVLAHSLWSVKGRPARVKVVGERGTAVPINPATGWPSITTVADCVSVWKNVLHHPPAASAIAPTENGYKVSYTPPSCTYAYYYGGKAMIGLAVTFNSHTGTVR